MVNKYYGSKAYTAHTSWDEGFDPADQQATPEQQYVDKEQDDELKAAIMQLSEREQKILEMAQQDALTGLSNRRYMETFVKERLEQGDVQQQTFIYFDLDHFKAVNDTFGHAMGDRVLVGVAAHMKEAFQDALLVRLGGDEFLAVMFEQVSVENVCKRIEEFIDKLQNYFEKCLRDGNGLMNKAGLFKRSAVKKPIEEYDRQLQAWAENYITQIRSRLESDNAYLSGMEDEIREINASIDDITSRLDNVADVEEKLKHMTDQI